MLFKNKQKKNIRRLDADKVNDGPRQSTRVGVQTLPGSESHEIEHPSACGPPYSTRHYTQLSMGWQRNSQHPPPQLSHLQSPFRFVPYCVGLIDENGDLKKDTEKGQRALGVSQLTHESS